jgi:hypothetical protein
MHAIQAIIPVSIRLGLVLHEADAFVWPISTAHKQPFIVHGPTARGGIVDFAEQTVALRTDDDDDRIVLAARADIRNPRNTRSWEEWALDGHGFPAGRQLLIRTVRMGGSWATTSAPPVAAAVGRSRRATRRRREQCSTTSKRPRDDPRLRSLGYNAEKRSALNRWAGRFPVIIEGKGFIKVTPIRQRAAALSNQERALSCSTTRKSH